MTHAEKEVRNQEIVKLRHDGKSMSEVAEMYQLTVGAVCQICKRYGVDGRMSDRKAVPQSYRNQYTSGTFDREANAIQYINERTPWFEYTGNYTGIDGYADVKCKTCGTVARKSFVSIRHGKARCSVCKQRETQEQREQLKQERMAEQEKARAEKKRQRFLNQTFTQVSLKVCPVCKNLFAGNTKYCSTKCGNSNRWRLKDGYRYLFPLKDVYARDNGICYLCGKQCDWNDYEVRDGVTVYGNMYPSRDHIIPKSRGGKNTWNNIRLAHRICNALKSDSPLVQKDA